MANPSLVFTDTSGSVTLTCAVPRLGSWMPDTDDIGPSSGQPVSLGTGLTIPVVIFRRDYVASFEFSAIRPKDVQSAVRFIAWLDRGGTATVNTADVSSNSYTVAKWPKKRSVLKYDPKTMNYTLTAYVLNTVNAPLVCQYVNT